MHRIVWNYQGLYKVLESPTGHVGKDLMRRALKVQSAAKAQAGVKTGELKKSIHIRRRPNTASGQTVEIGSSVKHALIHHEGTKPHVILPVRAKQLVFTSGGRVIRTNKVNHPGTRANKYLSDNLGLIDD